MKRLLVGLTLMVMLLVPALAFCPMSVDCPLHTNMTAYYKKQVWISGACACVYHCPMNHDVLLACD